MRSDKTNNDKVDSLSQTIVKMGGMDVHVTSIHHDSPERYVEKRMRCFVIFLS